MKDSKIGGVPRIIQVDSECRCQECLGEEGEYQGQEWKYHAAHTSHKQSRTRSQERMLKRTRN